MITGKLLLSELLRKAGLLQASDKMYYYFQKLKFGMHNKAFKKSMPDIVFPPPYMLYEAYRLDYSKYYLDGLETAKWVSRLAKQHILAEGAFILDWGCGPARIIRHLPALLPGSILYGTDYNPATIVWCKKSFPYISFSINGLQPPLNYPDAFFDFIYGISIFTHLSEQLHPLWMNELKRVLKPGGVLLITTQGAVFTGKLTAQEKAQFEEGKPVVRSKTREGHRTFSAFQPIAFMKELLSGMTILDHKPGVKKGTLYEQDVWLIKKLAD
jgi:ubiquinone/menaquinone biosynthesis C-methylase UbiE